VHISTEDASEVYFELEHVDSRMIAEGIDELSIDVTSRFPDASFGVPQPVAIAGRAAQAVRFTFSDRERIAIFSEQESPAHRVILDPRSATNYQILATLCASG
jgi:hypothetical protein